VFGARTISRPIVELTELTRRIAGGDFTQTIRTRGGSEIRVLAGSFNEMTRRLNESIEHLKVTTAAKERIESELQIAHEIQMSMVPKIFPPFPDRSEFDIFATLTPAKEVGGDFYEFFFLDEDRLCFAVGDVSGKGVPASLFMAVTKTLLRATAASGGTPGEFLARLNAEICRDNESCMFVTLFCGILTVSTGQVDYSSAGHSLPYRLSRDGVKTLDTFGGRALGLVPSSPYTSGQTVLRPGEALLLYTDGVTEAMDANEALYSEPRLARFLAVNHSSPPRQLIGDLVGDVHHFAGGAPQSDDLTALALLYRGTGQGMSDALDIKLGNRLAELDGVTEKVMDFGRRHGLATRVVHDLTLALEEVLSNVIKHGYPEGGDHEISLRVRVEPGQVRAEIEDDGRPFNPLEAPEPDTTKPLEERAVGGLGIHLVRKLMDALEYRRQGGKNLLTIRKLREP
jgi:sigma-B regulation protein RsbU (phosphoserine phosphatase)